MPYVDLGTWDCLTPFVGVGIGGAYNSLPISPTSLRTLPRSAATAAFGLGRGTSNWHLAWALYAGVSYA